MAKDTCYVNILLHGLFFMEFANNLLVVTAPDIGMHKYCMVNNGFLTEFPQKVKPIDIDLGPSSLSGLQKGAVNKFTDYPAIPQFSKKDAKVGDLKTNYRLQILLPQPEEIIPLRRAELSDFQKVAPNGNIAKRVFDSCSQGGKNSKFSLLTCLRYTKQPAFGSPPTVTIGFYAEHKDFPKISEMNATYTQAQAIWQTGANFDLQLQEIFPPSPKVCPEVHPGYGIVPDDENSLAELLLEVPCSSKKGTDVANCVQFGVNP
ncbi:MAG: hypothetical protein LAO78_24080 [Acidobacteriia bacterium]|nr:hypothetical protein [Terriglobia bacterium]